MTDFWLKVGYKRESAHHHHVLTVGPIMGLINYAYQC